MLSYLIIDARRDRSMFLAICVEHAYFFGGEHRLHFRRGGRGGEINVGRRQTAYQVTNLEFPFISFINHKSRSQT